MIDTAIFFEKFLQTLRFKKVRPYLIGDVLDFGGNKGELGKFVTGKYLAVNYDWSALEGKNFDTIVCLAVIEHLLPEEVFGVFKKFKGILKKDGRIFVTTPTRIVKPVLELMASLGIVDKKNIAEHKHYWSKTELYELAHKTGFAVKKYKKFQLGFNQLIILE